MWCFDRLSTNSWEMISRNSWSRLSTNGWSRLSANESPVILNEVKDLSFWVRKGFTKHFDRMPSEVKQATRFFAALRMTTLCALRMTMLSALRMTR
jgi:hypothetical protein